MTIRDLIKALADWDMEMKVEVGVAYHQFPLMSVWTKGGTNPHTLVLEGDTDLRIVVLTRLEREDLDRRREENEESGEKI